MSYPSLKIYIFFNNFFHTGPLGPLGPLGYIENCTHSFSQLNFISGTVFFFILSLVTVFDFRLLCELQKKVKNNLYCFLALSFQTHWLNIFCHALVQDLLFRVFSLRFCRKYFILDYRN